MDKLPGYGCWDIVQAVRAVSEEREFYLGDIEALQTALAELTAFIERLGKQEAA